VKNFVAHSDTRKKINAKMKAYLAERGVRFPLSKLEFDAGKNMTLFFKTI